MKHPLEGLEEDGLTETVDLVHRDIESEPQVRLNVPMERADEDSQAICDFISDGNPNAWD